MMTIGIDSGSNRFFAWDSKMVMDRLSVRVEWDFSMVRIGCNCCG